MGAVDAIHPLSSPAHRAGRAYAVGLNTSTRDGTMMCFLSSRRFRSTARVGLLLALSAGLAGCRPKPGTHDPGYVAKEWSMTMREFGIVPVFPPREDVQVGDVYAMPLPPDVEAQVRAVKAKGEFLPIP